MDVIRKKRPRTTPSISTASLPDIIFMLLFFFMITTTMRDEVILVRQDLPTGSQVVKVDKKALITNIYIGTPADQPSGEVAIQVNNRLCTLGEIGALIDEQRKAIPSPLHDQMSVNIKADRGVRMELISNIRLELRRAGVAKVNYVANKD